VDAAADAALLAAALADPAALAAAAESPELAAEAALLVAAAAEPAAAAAAPEITESLIVILPNARAQQPACRDNGPDQRTTSWQCAMSTREAKSDTGQRKLSGHDTSWYTEKYRPDKPLPAPAAAAAEAADEATAAVEDATAAAALAPGPPAKQTGVEGMPSVDVQQICRVASRVTPIHWHSTSAERHVRRRDVPVLAAAALAAPAATLAAADAPAAAALAAEPPFADTAALAALAAVEHN